MNNWTLLCSDRQFRNCQSKRRSIIEYTKDLYPNRRSGDASAFRRARWSGWEENKVSKTNSHTLIHTSPSEA